MFSSIGSLVFILFFLLFLSSCVATRTESTDTQSAVIIKDVPFVKQKYRFCGPAALTSVFRYYGQYPDQGEIAENVYTPELKGSLISDMKRYAERSGFSARTENGNIEKLTLLIDNKQPVILLVDKGRMGVKIQHYYVVYGYNPQSSSFIIHDGIKSARNISYSKLDSEWEKMNGLMLVINNGT